MKITKIFTAALISALAMTSSFAFPSVLNQNITAAEKAKIEKNETVIRNLKSVKNFGITSTDSQILRLQDEVKTLKPSYLAEVIQVMPYKGNENLPEKISQLIMDIPSYVGIPYWSERHEKWFDLYSSATIKSSTKNGNVQNVKADLYMEPFGTINTSISCEKSGDSVYYVSTNENNLKYSGVTCVKTGKMKSIISVTRDGDDWILYGVGAVNAPDVFFLRDRIETSFMNRIKTFCSYFFKKL